MTAPSQSSRASALADRIWIALLAKQGVTVRQAA